MEVREGGHERKGEGAHGEEVKAHGTSRAAMRRPFCLTAHRDGQRLVVEQPWVCVLLP